MENSHSFFYTGSMINMNDEPKIIGFNFLQQMDDYIKRNYKTMTCQEMYNIYKDFFNTLKDFRSNSSGFTGFPEFLVFRFVCHALGEFQPNSITDDTMEFVSTTDNKLVIGQSIGMNVNGINKKPDVLIKYDGKPISVIEIKTVTISSKTIDEVIERFNDFKDAYPKLNILLMIFWQLTETDKGLKKLKESQNKFLILDKNDGLLFNMLNESLKLSEIKQ